ncbi:uncharacterized protein LOC123558791 [Mercenaria mercenaria]|uniref:uncharacterized protein LOC123558791 n=1 Tax=Mercenaria mercenaria TaxID=6596 RepID=UPI001E1E1332|nr:uncharacterized protein LOC123558791 [Mercenaria mercenaria]
MCMVFCRNTSALKRGMVINYRVLKNCTANHGKRDQEADLIFHLGHGKLRQSPRKPHNNCVQHQEIALSSQNMSQRRSRSPHCHSRDSRGRSRSQSEESGSRSW